MTIQANSVRAEANASASSSGGGGIDVGAATANATTIPTVNAYVDTGSRITAKGSIGVTAIADSQRTGDPLNDFFQPNPDVDLAANTIRFEKHGLQDGDTVVYDRNGNDPLGTPSGPLRSGSNGSFSVIKVDDNTVKLGASFDGRTADAGELFEPQVGIDPTRDVIRFGRRDPNPVAGGDEIIVPIAHGSRRATPSRRA